MRTPEALFQVDMNTVETMFSQSGRGFYIPPYQRQYSWGNDEIDRLMEDLCTGLQSWLEDPDIVTFLGSIILIKDELFDQVEPAIKEHLPAEVMVVIDGQQRLSTISVLGALLHHEIVIRGKKLGKKTFSEDAWGDWLVNRYEQTAHRLLPLFQLDVGFGDCRYYPKIIRAYEDQWSRDPSSSQYLSPIAQFINKYIDHYHTEGDSTKPFKPKSTTEGSKLVYAVVRRFRSHLRKISAGMGWDNDPIFPSGNPFPKETQKYLFKDAFPEGLDEFLQSEDGNDARELLNLVAIANYLLTRCSVTLTQPMEDRFAFELFERLNTTGQQLTAYETFRPLVVKAEGLVDYRDSESHRWIKEIDKFVPLDLQYDKRTKATNDMLLPFAVAQTGTKLPKRLGLQRNWLRSTFEGLQEQSEKQRFVIELRNLVRCLNEAFHYRRDITAESRLEALDRDDDGLTVLCLDYLSLANNDICVGPLSRFYSELLMNPGAESSKAFREAVKAAAAFFTLYRWAFGTSGLPEVYRDLMYKNQKEEYGMPPMGRLVENSKMPTGKSFATYLGRRLTAHLSGNKDEWVRKVRSQSVCRSSVVARFALFAAFHDTIVDEQAIGKALPRLGKSGCLEMLSLSRWCDRPEVEHIAPVTRGSGWSDELYDDDNINLIGNLVLLPKSVNSSANNKSWEQKRLYYRILGSPEKIADYLDSPEAIELDVDISDLTPSTVQILTASRYHAYLAPIADVTGPWTAELVRERSERLASLVWDRLSGWLRIES